jgi:ribosomal protein L11 methylase PrmA
LAQIAKLRTGTSQSFLDIGTGTGILAIAALKLGYRPVEAFDFDPASANVVEIANELHQLGNRISRGASGFAGVRVGGSGFERKDEAQEPAQSRGACGPVTRDPNRV